MINFEKAAPQNYKKNRKKEIEYIVIHYTSNKGDSAKNNVDYFSKTITKTSAHYFVDDNEIWQSVNDFDIAFHCGAKRYKHKYCRNENSLGVEMCIFDKKGNLRPKTIDNTVNLVRELMNKYNISLDNVIRHFDVTGKICPKPMVDDDELWKKFKLQIETEENMKIYNYIEQMPQYAQDTFTRMYKNGIISTDEKGEIAVQECSLQPMVYLDRLVNGKIEKLPDLMRKLGL